MNKKIISCTEQVRILNNLYYRRKKAEYEYLTKSLYVSDKKGKELYISWQNAEQIYYDIAAIFRSDRE